MKRSAWLAAALLSALAVPALAGSTRTPTEDTSAYPKYDFTKRPDLRAYEPREKAPAGNALTEKQAKALAKDLFDNYQNISGLALFRFHKRTADEPMMTLEEITWADDALAREAKLSGDLQAEADAAFKAGIARRVPTPGMPHLAIGRPFMGRLKYIRSHKPTLDELRRDEYEALSSIGLSLSVIVREESEPAAEADPKERAETDKALAENRADLAKVRQEILNYRQEDAEREELRSSSIQDSKERVKRATAGGFEKRFAPADAAPGGQTSATPAPASGGKTAEQIIREANALPRAVPLRKRQAAEVPAP